MLHGIRGDTESELPPLRELAQERGVVAGDDVVATRGGPTALFDEVSPIRSGTGEDEEIRPAFALAVPPP